VSPLWPNQLLVGLSQQSIAMVQMGGLNKRVQQKQHAQIAKLESGWNQALSQLQAMLASMQQPKSKTLIVVLASEFVRYLALPAHGRVMQVSDKIDYARAAYREIYGNAAETWHIQCDDAAPNQPMITAAVDQALIDALTTLAHQYDMQLASVQPYLMPVFNRTKSQLSGGQLYFALVESGRLLFASLKNGHWQKIRSFALEPDWTEQLKNIAQREGMTTDAENDRILMVYAPKDKTTSLPYMSGWNLQRMGIENRRFQGHGQHYAMLEVV